MKTNSRQHAEILFAQDRARLAAYDFVLARKRWPLLSRPRNPYAEFRPGNERLREAWDEEFEATVARHRPEIAPAPRQLEYAI